jgi:hypothetical protein
MKRLVIAAVVLALVAAAIPVMADGKFTAWNQGNLFLYGQVGSDPAFVGWGPGWDLAKDGTGIGIDQEWAFGWDGKNIGFSGTIEFGSKGPAQLSWFGTYYKFADLVKVTLGAPRIDYRQFTFIEGAGFNRLVNGEYSITAELTLMKGLTIGLVNYVPLGTGYAATRTIDVAAGNGYQAISSSSAVDIVKNLGFGAMYAVPDLGTFMAQYKSNSNTMDIGANISAIKNIGIEVAAAVGFTYPDLTINTLASVQAAFAPLTVALDAGFNMKGTSAFAVEAKVEYAMGMIALGLLGGYDDGNGVALFNQQCGTWDGVEVYPYVKANFDGGYIQLGFVYAGGANTHSSVIAVPIIYSWSF